MTKLGLNTLVHAYLHLHSVEDCSNRESFRATTKAMDIIQSAAGPYEGFIAARREHRDHCKKCKSRGFGRSTVPIQERLEDIIATVGSLLERCKELDAAEERLRKKYGYGNVYMDGRE